MCVDVCWRVRQQDQEKAIAAKTEDGVAFTEKCAAFIAARAAIEASYGKELHKLVKSQKQHSDGFAGLLDLFSVKKKN